MFREKRRFIFDKIEDKIAKPALYLCTWLSLLYHGIHDWDHYFYI